MAYKMHRCTLADHKTGHALLGGVSATMAKVSGVKITHQLYYKFSPVSNERDKWVVIIRHPFEVITSGYRYHKRCSEWWAINPGTNIYEFTIQGAYSLYPEGNMSEYGLYKNKLNEMVPDDGLEYEMRTVGRLTVEAMYYWGYYNMPNVLTVKFEDFYNNFDGAVEKIARFYEFNDQSIPKIVAACAKYDLRRKDKPFILKNDHITNKQLEPFVYRKLWKPHHYNVAAEIFPKDVLSKFGYTQ